MEIDLDNKKFKPLSNTKNGEVSDATVFHYHQRDTMIWAEYAGGEILKGFLIGKISNRSLEFTYQHLNHALEIMTGRCHTRVEINSENKMLLHEDWEWTCKDFSKGKSTLIEA